MPASLGSDTVTSTSDPKAYRFRTYASIVFCNGVWLALGDAFAAAAGGALGEVEVPCARVAVGATVAVPSNTNIVAAVSMENLDDMFTNSSSLERFWWPRPLRNKFLRDRK